VPAFTCPNTLTIISHTVKKRTITLKVAVPGAGKLTATGKGLTKSSKTSSGRGTLTLTLKAKGSAKLKTKVKLTFTPTKGKHLAASVSAKFKRWQIRKGRYADARHIQARRHRAEEREGEVHPAPERHGQRDRRHNLRPLRPLG
jgi:hypothetical protein